MLFSLKVHYLKIIAHIQPHVGIPATNIVYSL